MGGILKGLPIWIFLYLCDESPRFFFQEGPVTPAAGSAFSCQPLQGLLSCKEPWARESLSSKSSPWTCSGWSPALYGTTLAPHVSFQITTPPTFPKLSSSWLQLSANPSYLFLEDFHSWLIVTCPNRSCPKSWWFNYLQRWPLHSLTSMPPVILSSTLS